MEDTRTLARLAKEAIEIQNASNLSGLVHGWSRSVKRLRELLPDAGTDGINMHPINILWSDKCASLTHSGQTDNLSAAYDICEELAKGE